MNPLLRTFGCLLAVVVWLGPAQPPTFARSSQPEQAPGSSTDGKLPSATEGTDLSIKLLPPFNEKRGAYGTWESVSVIYYLKNTAGRKVKVQYNNQKGEVIHLRESSGRVRKAVLPWGVNQGFRENKPNPTLDVSANVNVSAHPIGLTHLFGKLPPDRYTVVVELPAGRFSVDGKPLPRVVSKPYQLEVTAMTAALKKKIHEPTEQPNGITLKRVKSQNKQGKPTYAMTLTNKSSKTIAYSGYGEGPSGILYSENFCGDGKWRQQFMGLCGTGLISKQLKPGESAVIGMYGLPTPPAEGVISITRPTIGITIVGEKGSYHTIAAKPTVYLAESTNR